MRVAKKQFRSILNKKIKKKAKVRSLKEPIMISVDDIYDAFIDALKEAIMQGGEIKLRSFGVFKLKQHKGHKATFLKGSGKVSDYLTLKFIPSNVFIKSIRDSQPTIPDFENDESEKDDI